MDKIVSGGVPSLGYRQAVHRGSKDFVRKTIPQHRLQKYWPTSQRSTCEIHRFEDLEEEARRLRDLIVSEAETIDSSDSRNRFPRLLENRYKSFFKPLKQRLLDDESRALIVRTCRWEFENYYPDSI